MPGARAHHRVGHQLHGLVLADHPLVQDLIEVQQLLALALHEAAHGDACPACDDLGDLLLRDLFTQQAGPPLAFFEALLLCLQAPLELGEPAVP